MTYTINLVEVDKETLRANVTYTLEDKTEVTVDVPLFHAKTQDDVLMWLYTRELNEQQEYDAPTLNANLKAGIDSNVVGKNCAPDPNPDAEHPIKVTAKAITPK